VNDLGVCLDISSGRTSAGPPSDIKLSRRHAWAVLYGIRFFPENINLFAIILPFVKTEPAQNWITQTSLPHINALPTQRYKKFSTVCLVVCSVFAFCYTLFLSRVCLIYHLPTCECFCLSFFVCVSVCMYVLGERVAE